MQIFAEFTFFALQQSHWTRMQVYSDTHKSNRWEKNCLNKYANKMVKIKKKDWNELVCRAWNRKSNRWKVVKRIFIIINICTHMCIHVSIERLLPFVSQYQCSLIFIFDPTWIPKIMNKKIVATPRFAVKFLKIYRKTSKSILFCIHFHFDLSRLSLDWDSNA